MTHEDLQVFWRKSSIFKC